jgi:hypothetical protein
MKIKADNEFIDSLLNFGYSVKPVPNFMIVPIRVYNLIETDITFTRSEDSNLEIGFPYKIGYIRGFEVYVDIHLPPDKIIISWNKQEMRNNKIDSILDNVEKLDDIIIEVI